MTKQQVIDILENFRPSRDKFCPSPVDDYVDDRIDSRIDSIIEFVKREPDDDWIKCSEKMPENDKSVLVAIKEDGDTYICVGETFVGGDWMINGEHWYEKSDPAITHWMPLPEPPKGEIEKVKPGACLPQAGGKAAGK